MRRIQMRQTNERDSILSPRATRIGLLILVPLTLVFGVQAISWAVPRTWSHGDVLTADDLNRNFKALDDAVTAAAAAAAAASQPNPWVACGHFQDLRSGSTSCQIDNFPTDQFEYGFKYNSPEVYVSDCVDWNVGLKIVNRHPYMVFTDDPTNTLMALGGAIFYTETNAADDDIPASCPSGTWRHHYWRIVNGNVTLEFSNGCANLQLYCRRR
jgi:hypothetical protein